jgi:hypothetical protein
MLLMTTDCCCSGQQGIQGVPGIQGIAGQTGAQGIQGIQGPMGDCSNCPSANAQAEFAEVYSSLPQVLSPSLGANLPGQSALLEKTVFATSNIDVSQAAATGKITVNLAGWYDVSTGICGALSNLPSPLPVWTLSLFLNGVIVPGSTFACMTISPEQKSNETVADVFVHLNKGDVIELANTSTAAINLTAPTLGTNALPNSAYMKVVLLKAD